MQIGPNAKELFRLVEDFIDVIGFRMKDFRDSYQVTDNLGEFFCNPHLGERPPKAVYYCAIGITRPVRRGGKRWWDIKRSGAMHGRAKIQGGFSPKKFGFHEEEEIPRDIYQMENR